MGGDDRCKVDYILWPDSSLRFAPFRMTAGEISGGREGQHGLRPIVGVFSAAVSPCR